MYVALGSIRLRTTGIQKKFENGLGVEIALFCWVARVTPFPQPAATWADHDKQLASTLTISQSQQR